MSVNLDKIMSDIKKGVAEIINEERVTNLVKNYYIRLHLRWGNRYRIGNLEAGLE